MPHYTGYRQRAPPPLPDPSTLPFPGNVIRGCSACGLRAGATAPVPGQGPIPAGVMLIGEAPGCFPAGTFVLTPNGVQDISRILVGDIVLNGRGKPQKVVNVFSRPTTQMSYLKIRGMLEQSLTPNHPIQVIRATPCYDSHTRKFCFPCSRRSATCSLSVFDNYKPEWVAASALIQGDHVIIPDLMGAETDSHGLTPDADVVRIPFQQRKLFRRTKFKDWGVDQEFQLDPELAYILGWYMAEGNASIRNGTVMFNLGEGDGDLRFILEDQCRKVFGLACVWFVEGKGWRLQIHSRPLAAWFLDLFGRNQHACRVPDVIFQSSLSIIRNFVKGWYAGDGKHEKDGHGDGIVTASREAAYGLQGLLLRLGICPTLHKEEWDSSNGNTTAGGYLVAFPKSLKWEKERNVVSFKGQKLARVDSVRTEAADCLVYNIETEDNQYLVPFVVHNSNEDLWNQPFYGQAGQELNSLLAQASISRESVFITNCNRCKPPNNRTPTLAEQKACAHWLDLEVELVNPHIIVAMGATAIRHFLGPDAGTVEHLHGKPIVCKVGSATRIVLPAYHPAAALHNTSLLRQLFDDFQVLRGLVAGHDASDYLVADEYPNPVYTVVDTPEKMRKMRDEVREVGECAIDVETVSHDSELWSYQVSAVPGTAWFVPIEKGFKGRVDVTDWGALIIVHYYLHDIRFLNIPDGNFLDTMTAAYLTGRPQGLKELSSRLCGIVMKSYSEVVRPGQLKLSMQYLTEAANREWPDPPDIEEVKWDNKAGRVITRIKHPQHISFKIKRLLARCVDNESEFDPLEKWGDISELERTEVEKALGQMPESSLADIKFEDAVQYANSDAQATLRVKHKMDKLIRDLGLDFVLHMDLNTLPMAHDMMGNGMPVNKEHFRNMSVDYTNRMAAKAAEMASIVGHPFNPNSSAQVAKVVYGELGFTPTAYTKTKLISTDDSELKKVKHPVTKTILEYRRLSKVKGTYCDNLTNYSYSDANGVDCIHTTIKTTRVETGRWASSDPVNLQNIPVRNKEGKLVRKGFVAAPRTKLVEGDLKQIEMCTQAHLANCKGLIELFLSGKDPHTTTASKIFGVPYEEAKKDKFRYPCKRAGFGIIYLIGAEGLYSQITEYIADLEAEGEPIEIEAWSVEQCQKFIDDYYKLYPEIKDYQQEMAAMARRLGYTRDIFGRIRFIPEVNCPIRSIQEAGCRQAANFPVTASAQGILKVAMGNLWRELPKTEWRDNVKYLMQIHDSLVLQVTDDEKILKPYLRWMEKVVSGSVQLKVPVGMDFKVGSNWADTEKYSLKD